MRILKLSLVVAFALSTGCVSCFGLNGNDNSDNGGTNNANSGTNNNTNSGSNNMTNVPDECTPDFQYESWSITEDRRLIKACSPYVLDDSANVKEGATLTIDAGVEIQVDSGAWIRVGSGSEGRIVVNGTADDPVVFTSSLSSPLPGGWLGLRFASELGNESEMHHFIVRYGGEDSYGQAGCLTIDSGVRAGVLTMTDGTFENCAQGGMAVGGDAFAELSNLTFRDTDGYGMALDANILGAVTTEFTYENTDYNRITGGEVPASATWVGQPVPYRVDDSINVRGEDDPVVTLEEGLTLQFDSDSWFRVGSGEDGGLIVNGSEAAPVVFESAAGTPAPADWLGVRFEQGVLAETSLDNVVVRHGGDTSYGTQGCLTALGDNTDRISITNSRFEMCAQAGVSSRGVGFGFAEFENNTFVSSEHGVDLSPNAVSTIGTQNYEDTPANRIAGNNLSRTGTWVAQDVPYRVRDSINVRGDDSPVLTIEGDVTLRFSEDSWLRVGSGTPGALVVQGTADAPVIFESDQAEPSAAAWLGLRFEGDNLSETSLDYAVVRHGGDTSYGTQGCLTSIDEEPGRISITNSVFETCGQAGISARRQGFTFAAFSDNTFRDSPYGIAASPNAFTTVEGAQTYENVPANLVSEVNLTESGTWLAQDVPYDFAGSVNVRGTNQPVLTIAAGAVIRAGEDDWLRVGSGDAGGLVAQGTAGDPVVFTTTAANPAPGSWLGIRFEGSTLNGTLLDYVEVEYAGDNSYGQAAAVHLQSTESAVTITNSNFSNNEQGDIYVDGNSTPTLMGNTGTVVMP